MKHKWLSGNALGTWYQRPGFKSQVLQNSILFFISSFHAALTLGLTMHIQEALSTCPRRLIKGSRTRAYGGGQSKHHTGLEKSTNSSKNGPGFFKSAPPILGTTPPWFALSFFFISFFNFSFHFFYLLNLINLSFYKT